MEVFQTQSGKELIINLDPSHPSDELLTLINELRSAAINSGSQISKDFFIHITLGRIDAEDAGLDEIKDIISSISFSPFKVSIKEAEYRYFRADTIDHWKFIE